MARPTPTRALSDAFLQGLADAPKHCQHLTPREADQRFSQVEVYTRVGSTLRRRLFALPGGKAICDG